jgi:hypothetical protein
LPEYKKRQMFIEGIDTLNGQLILLITDNGHTEREEITLVVDEEELEVLMEVCQNCLQVMSGGSDADDE